ncbi:helix-turn-helix domain-containing protein [Halosimplex sp. TS25]|uniref:helix-turn-helix domain-containing protein n=1 Tax=Halosimplex rarum TaxID=3396619 RepID=UPI0039EA46AE
MKHVRLTARLDPERAPAFFDLLANTPAIERVAVRDWNLTAADAMLLFAVDGDPVPLAEAAPETEGVEGCEVSGRPDEGGDGGDAQVLVHVRRSAVPIFSCLASALEAGGLIVRTPVVFRDGEVHARIVGDPGPLQDAFERQGDDIDVRVDEISSTPTADRGTSRSLSDRQREAVVAAQELGYYDQPRGATHQDVAAVLGCSAQTAGDHLRKAEAKLVDAAMDALGSEV